MPDLFISHATKDDTHADALAAALATHDLTCWIDHQGGLEPGTQNWDRAIRDAIKACGAGLLLMSPRSLASDVCAAECLTVRGLGKPLYVAYLDTCAQDDIWLYIKMIQYADLRADFNAGAAAIARALKGEKSPAAPTPVKARITGAETMRAYLPYLNTVPLTGRDADLEKLRAMLGAHVTQITAVGGTGKSRIAAEIALSAAHGAIWHRCSETSGAYQVIDLIRQHYGFDEKTPDDRALAALDSGAPLIVIDNAEDVTAGTERRTAYTDLLQRIAAHGAFIVLTARAVWDELKPRKEHPLHPITLDQAEQVALAFAAAEGITLEAGEARQLAEHSRLHPRLIEFSIRQLHERDFADVKRQLVELKHDDVQEMLDEMIRKTVRQMRETAKSGANAEALLKRLTVMRGAFDREAVRALTPDGMNADDALVTLTRWKFVRKDGERWKVDDVVSGALPPDADTQAAHFAYYAGLHADGEANNNEDRHPLIAADWLNIRAGLAWGLEQQPTEAVAWIDALGYSLMLRDAYSEWRELAQQGYEAAARHDDLLGQANMLKALGDVAQMTNEYGSAREYYAQALPVYEAIGDRLGAANTLKALGDVARMTNEYGSAREYYGKALHVYEKSGSRLGAANTFQALGDVARMTNEYWSAREYFGKALTLGEQIGDFTVRLNSLVGLARVEAAEGHQAEACAYFRRLFALADSHPFFKSHPVVDSWRRQYADLGCGEVG